MPEQISWTLNVNVQGGPKVPLGDELAVDAYDVVDVTVADTLTKTVQFAPAAAGTVRLLVVKASKYGEDLTYKVNVATADVIKLDAPLILIGEGSVGLLGTSPNKLLVSNGLGEDVSIRVLVGRSAI